MLGGKKLGIGEVVEMMTLFVAALGGIWLLIAIIALLGMKGEPDN